MKLKKFLKYIDTATLNCNIYITYKKQSGEFGSDLIYAGNMYNIPYWLVDYNIDEPDVDGEPICYHSNLYTDIDDEEATKGYSGLVITLKERD